jgi:hypothetical protein
MNAAQPRAIIFCFMTQTLLRRRGAVESKLATQGQVAIRITCRFNNTNSTQRRRGAKRKPGFESVTSVNTNKFLTASDRFSLPRSWNRKWQRNARQGNANRRLESEFHPSFLCQPSKRFRV